MAAKTTKRAEAKKRMTNTSVKDRLHSAKFVSNRHLAIVWWLS